MKNIKFNNLEKFNSDRYELVEDKIYKDTKADRAFDCNFVTAIHFELEEEDGSQYPLEDILDKFRVVADEDLTTDFNIIEKDGKRIQEYGFYGTQEEIKALLSIEGKRVYNEEEGELVHLRID